jgi:hypothetical protein
MGKDWKEIVRILGKVLGKFSRLRKKWRVPECPTELALKNNEPL